MNTISAWQKVRKFLPVSQFLQHLFQKGSFLDNLLKNDHKNHEQLALDTTAKCRHLKNLTCTCRDFVSGVYLSEAKDPIPPSPPPPTNCTRVYSTLIHTGKGGEGGELNQRERERGKTGEYRAQSRVKNTDMTECTQEIGFLS